MPDASNESIVVVISVEPFVRRRARAKLNEEAESEAIAIFGANLRQLLMTPPCKGKIVMAIDPGFSNGCKVAVVSPQGEILGLDKFFLASARHRSGDSPSPRTVLKQLVLKHECEIIALGNGVGCRETESLLSNLIEKNVFLPMQVSYTIISEQGVSIYSCSPAALMEFPDLDATFVSAVSLARRLQDPLSEFLKVEPKHLGVGMYQHDVKEKKLASALDEVVSECVSFVGVDINTASVHLLRRVAGLTESKAKSIIEFRSKNCPFRRREDLTKVPGIKTETFKQCSGFIRIIPSTARCRTGYCCSDEINPLDRTNIHPDSYHLATRIAQDLDLRLNRLGSPEFIDTVKKKINALSLHMLAKKCGSSTFEISFIIECLTQANDYDVRNLSLGPVFRKGIKKFEEIKQGDKLEGLVRNVVSFGVFVDLGVGTNGLVHVSQMADRVLRVNDRISVEVISVEMIRKRIQLRLIN